MNLDFIQYTIKWAKGEILESTITAIVGLIIIVASILFWKFGNTPNARAMILPLLIVGLIPASMGIAGIITNNNRISEYQESWVHDNEGFVLSEKARVEGFDNIFKFSYPAAVILVIGGAILFFLVTSANWKAISLSLMLIGLMAYFIDFFAAERAEEYLLEINNAIENTTPNT